MNGKELDREGLTERDQRVRVEVSHGKGGGKGGDRGGDRGDDRGGKGGGGDCYACGEPLFAVVRPCYSAHCHQVKVDTFLVSVPTKVAEAVAVTAVAEATTVTVTVVAEATIVTVVVTVEGAFLPVAT